MSDAGPGKRILLTGANGQVGLEIIKHRGCHEILALAREDLDITDAVSVGQAVEDLKPDIVINAAAYTAVDRAEEEPELAYAVNEKGPANLTSACRRAGIPFFHISTDYVFDGTARRPYVEEDPVAPLGVYGKSKEAGERAVRAGCDSYVILRTSWVFSSHGTNFVRTMLRLMCERPELGVVADQHGCPTAAPEIAKTLLALASRFQPEFSGIYHFAQPEPTTWFAFAETIRREAEGAGFPLKVAEIRPITTEEYPTPARRPAWSVLDCSKLDRVFGLSPRPWRESLKEVLSEIAPEYR